MDAQGVIEKIRSDAAGEAAKITEQAELTEQAEAAKLEQELEQYRAQTESLAEKILREQMSHELAAARMRAAKNHLAEKRKILDEVFERAAGQLRNLPDEQYRDLMHKLMAQAVETGDEEMVIDTNENRIDERFIEEVNNRLPETIQGNLRLANDREHLGVGFILRRGRIKTNVSLDVLLAEARQALEIELAGQLFRNQSLNE